MKETVEAFFARVDGDEALRRRLREAEANYPGSLEIREAVVEDVLLPVAAELGLPFTLAELRAYETRKKLSRAKDGGEALDDPDEYWLLDRGWTYDYEGAARDREQAE